MYDDGICSSSQKTACLTRNFKNNPRLIYERFMRNPKLELQREAQ
ncbi:hypothetical protein APA_3716 [Pseudanabaena sp. lw0831]|nr:hypothetical protein APA_3716 [Pseudanabaena sp. lw0831]